MIRKGIHDMYQEKNKKEKLITLGEIMLRFTPPNYEKLRTANCFEARYGGSEANVALSLANLGIDSAYFTVVPDNSLGKSAIRMLKSNNVDCESVIFSTPEETPTHRLGTYYLETGYGIRPSKVIYDRKHSAFAEYDFKQINLEKLLDGYTWLHLSGITPALGKHCRKMVMDCLKIARKNGITVSFDGNFRSALWSWEEARNFCTECLPYVDVLMGIEPYHLWKEEKNPFAGDIKDEIPFQPDFEQQELVFEAFAKRYPNLKCIARHVRYTPSCSENSLKAYLWYERKTYESKKLTFPVLDRVGGGDAFVSGIIYALMNKFSPEDTVNFGVASSAIKHTLHGDGNITDDSSLIRQVMQMNFDIKR